MAAEADLLGHVADLRVRHGAIPGWAKRYGYGERQIKNWLATGREAGELPPFDEPPRMADWFSRHVGKIPGRLARVLEEIATAGADPAGGKGADPVPPVPFEVPDISGDALGVEADLLRFRRASAVAHRMHEEALARGDTMKAKQFMEQAREISGEMRQLEKLVQAMREQSGEWYRAAEVKREVSALLNVLLRALLGRGGKASGRLGEAGSDGELQAVWKSEIQAVFAECCRNGFAEGFELGA